MFQVLDNVRNSYWMKGRVTQKFSDCNSTRKRCANDKSFQSLGYACLVSQYSTMSKETLAKSSAD